MNEAERGEDYPQVTDHSGVPRKLGLTDMVKYDQKTR